MDDRVDAIVQMRDLLRGFVGGEMPLSVFVPAFESLFAAFDPVPERLDGLDADAVNEYDVYSGFLQGSWGGANPAIPRSADWQYGVDVEPYAWIDADRCRDVIREELGRLGVGVELHKPSAPREGERDP